MQEEMHVMAVSMAVEMMLIKMFATAIEHSIATANEGIDVFTTEFADQGM